MKNVLTFMIPTAILFIVAAEMAVFVWHSWYLYYGAILAGYVALMLLTVILNNNASIEFRYINQFVNAKSYFYWRVMACYIIIFLASTSTSFAADYSTNLVLLLVINFIVLAVALVITMYWCEKNEWRFWLNKAFFG